MTLYLVRHAKAGSRAKWDGDDMLRPLTARGWRQADLLGSRLSSFDPTALRTSRYVRCRQTLEPLARLVDLEVVDDDRLLEGVSFAATLTLLDELPDRAVMCSHGDVIPEVVAALARRGCDIVGPPDWRKGSVWVLERDGDGMFTTATAWPPPHPDDPDD